MSCKGLQKKEGLHERVAKNCTQKRGLQIIESEFSEEFHGKFTKFRDDFSLILREIREFLLTHLCATYTTLICSDALRSGKKLIIQETQLAHRK